MDWYDYLDLYNEAAQWEAIAAQEAALVETRKWQIYQARGVPPAAIIREEEQEMRETLERRHTKRSTWVAATILFGLVSLAGLAALASFEFRDIHYKSAHGDLEAVGWALTFIGLVATVLCGIGWLSTDPVPQPTYCWCLAQLQLARDRRRPPAEPTAPPMPREDYPPPPDVSPNEIREWKMR